MQKTDIPRQDVTASILSPEEVINQRFQPTKFREGYAQNEVDDFLDRIATGLREWHSENEQLRRRLGPSQYGTPTTPS
ncbi:DivIVA domain-containing protein [Arthrobacter sp. zg-Y238]|uniref:DivIVA domain-containing protein n=1 Tax=Arthrobacter sp. zg-Y238 TaxID=2964614 RepID=UPI00351CD853